MLDQPQAINRQATNNEQSLALCWNRVCEAILNFICTYLLCCCNFQRQSPSTPLIQHRIQHSDPHSIDDVIGESVARTDRTLERLDEEEGGSRYVQGESSLATDVERSGSVASAEHSTTCSEYPLVNLEVLTVGSRNLPGEWKEITDVYAHTDYTGNPVGERAISRVHHGAQHQARTAMWGLVLLQLLRDQGVPEALSFDDGDVNLIILACLFHDSGRRGEGPDSPEWEENSGRNCRAFMEYHGYCEADISICQAAIDYKSQQSAFPYKHNRRARLILWILHFADALDVIRVRKRFDPQIPMRQCEDFPSDKTADVLRAYRMLSRVVRSVVIDQGDWISGGKYSWTIKETLEKAENPLVGQLLYLQVTQPDTFSRIESLVHSLLIT